MILALSVILLIVFVGLLMGARITQWQVTMPMAMIAAGMLIGWQSSTPLLLNLDSPSVERGVEVVLAILLFLDATEIRGSWRDHLAAMLRLVLIAIPVSLFAAVLTAKYIFPAERFSFCLILACIALPTDMAPAARLLGDHRVPQKLRDILNAESGYNDGLITPVFVLALAFFKKESEEASSESLNGLLPSMAWALFIGITVGVVAAFLVKRSADAEWATRHDLSIAILALPLLSYTLALGVESNGFVAAFVTGLAFRAVQGPALKHELEFTEGVATFAAMALWFVLGQLSLLVFMAGFNSKVIVFSLLCLTVLRIVPVIISLTPSSLSWRHRTFIGWFGPRGIASIVFALLALPHMPEDKQTLVLQVLVTTVLGSVVLHGLSCAIAPRWAEVIDDATATPHLEPHLTSGKTKNNDELH